MDKRNYGNNFTNNTFYNTSSNCSIGNTNRRYYPNYSSINDSINFTTSYPNQTITPSYLPGLKKKINDSNTKISYENKLNKYKLLEKEIGEFKFSNKLPNVDFRQQSQSFSNLFSNNPSQFENKDNLTLNKPFTKLSKRRSQLFETSRDSELNKNNKINLNITLDNSNYNLKDASSDQNFSKLNKSYNLNLEKRLSQPKILIKKLNAEKEENNIDQYDSQINLKNNLNLDKTSSNENKNLKINKNFYQFYLNKFNSLYHNKFKKISEMTNFLFKKWFYKLFVSIIFIIFILTAIKSSYLSTRSTKSPVTFFPDSPFIKDFQFGYISELSRLAIQHDVTFVMYYAPWDADCIKFKKEYETISKHYKNQIFFVAVNCWWSEGECNKLYQIKKYPVLVAHIKNIGEVDYKGPLVASYLIPFLDNLLNPVFPIQNEGDLLDLKSKHDGVVVGYFDFTGYSQPYGYKSFLLASIKALFQDPWRKVQFAIVSSKKSAVKLYIKKPQTVVLFLWNNTLVYSGRLKKIEDFLKWIYTSLNEDKILVDWITPEGFKSNSLSRKLLKGSTLILFTPRSLILGISPYFDILREVAMDYYNCNNSPQIKSLIHRSILRRRLKEEKLFELEEKCHEIAQSKLNLNSYEKLNLPKDLSQDDLCCHSQLVNWRSLRQIFDKCFCTACINIDKKKCPSNCKKFNCLATASRYLMSFEPNLFNSTIIHCDEIKHFYQPKLISYYDIKITCSGLNLIQNENEYFDKLKPKTNYEDKNQNLYFKNEKFLSNFEHSDESMIRMIKNFEEHHCQRLNLGLNYNDFNFPDSGEGSSISSQKWRQNFTGLNCKTNKTLNFVAIDSLMYQSFTESLGINVFNETHATVMIIVEAENENIFILDNHYSNKNEYETNTINKKKIYEFIKNYKINKLRRYLKSSLNKKISSSDLCINKTDENGRKIICVPEITTHTFNDIVLDNKNDILLMYYTPWCVFCTSIAHTFLNVAKFFTGIEGIIFARINADVNDLPFEYSVDKYPSLIFFPSKNKLESVIYPSNQLITTTTLIHFVLTNVNDKVKWQILFKLCNEKCLIQNLAKIIINEYELKNQVRVLKQKIRSLIQELNLMSNINKYRNLKKKYTNFLKLISLQIASKQHRYKSNLEIKSIILNRLKEFGSKKKITDDLNNQFYRDLIKVFDSYQNENLVNHMQLKFKNSFKTKLSLKRFIDEL